MADDEDEVAPYGYGRYGTRSNMFLLFSGGGSDDDTEGSSTSSGSYASVGMPLSRLLISVPGGRRSRLSTGSGSSYNMIGSLIQMLMSSPAMDESSDETEPLPLPPAKGENKNQSESSKGEGQKPRNSDEEIDRLRKILEQGGQKQTVKNKTEDEKKGESSDATGQEIEHEPCEVQGNLQEVDEVKVEDQHLSQLETASEEHDMKSDITTIDINDKESGDKSTETAGPVVSIEIIQKDEILPLSQQLKKDADRQSMNFLKSLWSAPVDNSLVNNSNIFKPLRKRGESTEKVLEASHVQSSTFQYHHKDNIPRGKPVVDNINSSAAGNISRSLSEDGVISPGERLKPNFQDAENLFNKPSRSISLTEQDLSDGDSVEEDCDYSNDLGGQLPEHDLDKEASNVKGQASDQSSPIELPCENNKKMFKSKHKDDFYKAQESAEEAVKVLEKEVNKQKMKGDNSSSTEPGDLKSDDNTKPVTSSQRSTDQNIKSSQFSPDSYDDDFGGDYDERYGYSPMNSKYAKLAKSPLATQISRLTGVMSGLQSLAEQHGFEIKDVTPDGNCMFSALVDQLRICGNFDFSTQSLRKAAVSYLRDNPYHEDGTHLQSFLYRETWDKYLQRMEQETVWGDHMVLQACTEVLECKIYVYKPSTNETVLAPNSTEADESSDLFLGHVGESHFVSLRRTDWEKLWHLKAQIHRNRKRNRNLTHKYLKSTAKMNSLKKKTQALEKKIENISQDSSLPSEIPTDQQEKMSQDVDGQDETASASNTTNRQSSSVSEQDHIEDTVSLAEEMEIEDEPEETESFGACSDVKTLVENCNAFDNDSQLPLPHISYLIDNLLRTDYMCVSDSTVEFKTKGGFCQLAGSIPEGFDIYLRNYNRKAKSVQIYTEKYPKLIRIFADGEVHMSQEGRKGYYDLILEQSNCHSGYTNLRPFRPDLWSKRVFHSDDNKPLLTHMIMSISSSKSSLMSKNAFSGYRCIEWPKEAAEWLTRDRPNGWPSKDAMRIIKSTDCLVISRAHPLTENKGIEWQIIFPQAEQILANECLTKHQLYCFKVFKILVNFHCREKSSAFTTTHLKTVLFYACEEIPTQCWSENIGGCVLYLLDKFLMFIMTRNVPNYFIQRNNMIDHLPESDLKFYEEKVHALRMFPVMSLYVLAEEHGINQVQILIDPILDDAKRYKTDIPRTGMAKEVFVTTTMKLAMYFMGFECYSEGCNIAQKAYEDLLLLETDNEANKPASPAMSFQDFILKFLQEEYEEDKYTYAVEFDKRLKTRLYRELQNGDEVVTLEDIVGKELAGSLSYIPIPKSYTENTIALVGYIDELARRHFVKSKLEDSACLLRCAISKAKLFHEEMVDVSQLEDQEIKEKVSKQNYRKMSSMNCKIMQIYHHLYTCYNAMGQVELIQEYIHDFEEVCERTGQPYYYKDLADIWQALGETEKSREIRKKLKTLRSSSIPEETWL